MATGWKVRNPLIVPGLTLSESITKEISIGAVDFYVAASGAGIGASGAVYRNDAGSTFGFQFTGACATSALGFIRGCPQDIALIGSKASGSGTVYIDWLNNANNSKNAVVSCSLIAVATACLLSGGSVLGGTCVVLTGGKACQMTSTSLFQFKTPPDRNSVWNIRFKAGTQDDAHTSGIEFCVFNLRLRYKSDRLGS